MFAISLHKTTSALLTARTLVSYRAQQGPSNSLRYLLAYLSLLLNPSGCHRIDSWTQLWAIILILILTGVGERFYFSQDDTALTYLELKKYYWFFIEFSLNARNFLITSVPRLRLQRWKEDRSILSSTAASLASTSFSLIPQFTSSASLPFIAQLKRYGTTYIYNGP